MKVTPLLPDWITDADVPGYVSAHSLCPGETRLYGTESLYGDWSGEVLLLAKDYGPSRILHDRLSEGDPRPYRHEPKMITNRRLQRLAEPFVDLGLLYGSALANMLRDDGHVTGTLPNRREAVAYGVKVTRFVCGHMPALRRIVCLGHEAWEVASAALCLEGDWKAHRDAGEPLGPLVAAFHPAARVSLEAMSGPWQALQRYAA